MSYSNPNPNLNPNPTTLPPTPPLTLTLTLTIALANAISRYLSSDGLTMSFTSAIVTAVLVFLCANVQTLCTGQAAQPAPYHKHICPYLAPPLDHTTTAFPDTKPSRDSEPTPLRAKRSANPWPSTKHTGRGRFLHIGSDPFSLSGCAVQLSTPAALPTHPGKKKMIF